MRKALAQALHGAQRRIGIVDGEQQDLRAARAGRLQQVEARRVAVVGLVAEAPHGLDLRRVVVDDRGADTQAAQHAHHHLPKAAESGHDHRVGFADRIRRRRRVSLDALREEALVGHHQQRRGQHRRNDRRVQHRDGFRGNDPACRAEENEGELAGLRQRHGEQRRIGAVAVAEGFCDRIEQDDFQRDDACSQPEDDMRNLAEETQVDRHSHGDEEQPQQQALERVDVELQLVAVFAFGEHHPGEEGAERHGQAHRVGEHRAADHQQQREADEDLAQARLGDVLQHRAHQHAPGEHQRGDEARRLGGVAPAEGIGLAAEEAEREQQRDHRQVLEQQHRERGLAARRLQQVLLRERGEADGGRGHGDAHAGDHADHQRLAEQLRDARHRGDGDRHLYRAEAEDRAAQRPEALRVQFEADQEQQQHHAELGEVQHRLRLRDQAQAPGTDRHAGDEIAEHRAEAEPLEERHRDHAGGEIHQRLFEKALGFHG